MSPSEVSRLLHVVSPCAVLLAWQVVLRWWSAPRGVERGVSWQGQQRHTVCNLLCARHGEPLQQFLDTVPPLTIGTACPAPGFKGPQAYVSK